MSKLENAQWRKMMDFLRHKQNTLWRNWFNDLRPQSLEAGHLRIYTPSPMHRNYLQQKCVEQFQEAAQSVTGTLIAITFVNEPDPHWADDSSSAAHSPVIHGSSTAGTARVTRSAVGNGRGGGTAVAVADEATGGHALLKTPGDGRKPTVHGPPAPLPRIVPVPADASPSLASPVPAPAPSFPPRPVREPIRLADQTDLPGDVHFDQIVISPDNSFENFVPGPANQLAFSAAVAVANQPGTAYNPLFIHGGVGLGKTHLLQAICQKIIHDKPDARICYLSCDSFMNQFIDCVQKGKMTEFRHRYREVDVLVIDDIHFLTKAERSQEEFFHTFNDLYQRQRQIVLSSDSPPGEIPKLEERLTSRFQWGLVINVTRPDYETRLAIVRAKAKLRELSLPEDVASFIAGKIETNARELEGAINNLLGKADLLKRPIDLALARETLGELPAQGQNSNVGIQSIIDVITQHYNVKLSDLQSKRRHKSITLPRQVCMWLARKRTRFSLQEIGGYFGGRDHTTVMHSIQTIEDRSHQDPGFHRQLEQFDDRICRQG